MQLLYGNDGINYRTIDKSPDMSEGVEKLYWGHIQNMNLFQIREHIQMNRRL